MEKQLNVDPRNMQGIAPRHAAVTSPKSRAVFAREAGELPDDSLQYSLEGGKFFPATESGLQDPLAPEDIVNRRPPRDGFIASGDLETHPVMPTTSASVLNEAGADRWKKHDVKAGQPLEVTWSFHAMHKSRRWKGYITKPDWNPEQKLSRAQFDLTPIEGGLELTCQPFWSCDSLMPPSPQQLTFQLPKGYSGYHVLLLVWEVADTANAFYQVIDLSFT